MITEIQKNRFRRIKLNDQIKIGAELRYCIKCDWDAERTGGFIWKDCPECGESTDTVKMTNEVMNLMNW